MSLICIFSLISINSCCSPFYGYHPKEHQFLKIQFYNPYLTKKAASLLQNAAICGRVLQSFESHIPYILQFFMDYNLYGMSFIHINTENIVYRVQEEASNRILGNGLIKTSRCRLEADIKGVHILNYLSYAQTNQTHQNPGIAFIWEDEKKRRRKLEIQVRRSYHLTAMILSSNPFNCTFLKGLCGPAKNPRSTESSSY